MREIIVRMTEEYYKENLAKGYALPELIRCKDCKHYADDACDRYADETLGYVHSTQADGFCWVAERKDNGEVSND